MSDRLSFDQTDEDNKATFIKRLVESAGWTQEAAEQEWESIQNESEDSEL